MPVRLTALLNLLIVGMGCSQSADPLRTQIVVSRRLFDQPTNQFMDEAPVLIIASIKHIDLVRSDLRVDFEGNSLLVHLVAATVESELCLRGDIPNGPVEFLAYILSEKNERELGWRPLFLKEDRRMVLPLRRDKNVLRPMVDLVDTFPRVTSGLHRRSVPTTRNSVESVCRVLLKRGEDIRESIYLDGLSSAAGDCLGWSREATTKILTELSHSADPNTGAYACALVAELLDRFRCLCDKRKESSLLAPVQESLARQRLRYAAVSRGDICGSRERR